MAKDWEAAEKAAKKILGPDAEIPEWPSAPEKAAKRSEDAWKEFEAVRQRLQDVLDEVKEEDGNFQGAWEAVEEDIKKETFGLKDPKKDKDKIAAARKEYLEAVDIVLQMSKKTSDDMKKVDAAMKIIMAAQ